MLNTPTLILPLGLGLYRGNLAYLASRNSTVVWVLILLVSPVAEETKLLDHYRPPLHSYWLRACGVAGYSFASSRSLSCLDLLAELPQPLDLLNVLGGLLNEHCCCSSLLCPRDRTNSTSENGVYRD